MLSNRQLSRVRATKPDTQLSCVFIAVATLFTAQSAFSADNTIDVAPVAVTGNPLGVASDELVTPVSVLNGRELSLRRASTIGETLNGIPGVAANQFGPNASRPVIRGLDGERVRMLQNGTGILDASSLSFDHAVGVDPLIIEQIDIIRGPAALLYGGSAVGGVVNAIDHRIPTEQLDGVLGRAETRFGGPASTRSGVAVIDFGNERFAVHVDGYNRKTDDLDIPGFAVSKRKSAADGTPRENKGKLNNSNAQQDGGAIGTSLTFENGYIGASYSVLNNTYGTTFVEDGAPISIDMESKRWDIASEFTDLGGFIDRTKVKLSHTDYMHVELEGDEIGTTFMNDGWQGTFEVGHAPIGNLKGVAGYQYINTDFSAIGEEAFVPGVSTKSQALYVYEELPIDAHKVTFGARFGRDKIDAVTGVNKNFSPNSYALGGIYQLNNTWSVAANLSHNERAPSYFELLADGVHVATNQFERGDVNLGKEKSNGIDAQLRWKQGRNSFSFGAYATRFNNFIALTNTGNTFIDGAETFDINAFSAVPAMFKGVEFEGKWQATSSLSLNMRGDYVHAKDTRNNDYLPRISPARIGLGADYRKGRFSVRFDALHAFKQSKTAANELVTDSYNNVSATAAYKLPVSRLHVEIFAKANNLLDEEIRDHASFLKDVSPSGERSLQIGARADF
tara:strand:- start:1125 stop:3158 length:2034 start_codon:yes stop_codon:yes gene_type:complete